MNEEMPVIENPTESLPPVKLCNPLDLLGRTIYDLLKLSPENKITRTLVQAKCRQPVPEGLKSSEAILSWIELNIAPPKLTRVGATPHYGGYHRGPTINIPISGSETESGHCNYTRRNYGQGTFPITETDLEEMASQAEDWPEFVGLVCERISDDWRDHVDMDDWEDEEHDEHQCEDTDNSSWEWNGDRVQQQLREALNQICPEIAHQLE